MKILTQFCTIALALVVAGSTLPGLSFGSDAELAADPHAHHQAMPETHRRLVEYTIPDIKLVRDDGKTVSLPDELNEGYPVVLNFIFTTCTTVCPLTSQTFSQLQRKLGTGRDRVRMVSISIDPEQDTPERLADYAKKYGAGPQWRFYTGTRQASVIAQRAFDVYRGDKMNHSPVTLLRAAADKPWIRIEGFATANSLLAEVQNMLAADEPSYSDHMNHASK